MELSKNTIERICRIFGHLAALEQKGIDFVSAQDLALAVGATDYTIRKDISLLGVQGYTRRGYEVKHLKAELGRRLHLNQNRKACIVGLGRLGTALLDYENFQEDGFKIVAGFDSSINKIERLDTQVAIYGASRLEEIVKVEAIELGIIAVPAEAAQETADLLVKAGVKGILNFSPAKIVVPENIVYLDLDFTNALRFIAAQLVLQKQGAQRK